MLTPYFFKINFNIVLAFFPTTLKPSLPLRFFNENVLLIYNPCIFLFVLIALIAITEQ
jgi:hypothetical protein